MKVDRYIITAVFVSAIGLATTLYAAEEPSSADNENGAAIAPEPESANQRVSQTEASKQAEEAARDEARRRVVAGLIITGGLLVAGVAVLVLTVLWAHRLRRIARQALPTQHTGDDLWYLRPSKMTLPGTCGSDEASGSDASSDEPVS